MNDVAEKPKLPTAKLKRRSRFSPLWLIPILAAGLVAYLGYNALSEHGPEITLVMSTADGLVVDQTQLKHKAVPLGTVDDISLAPDMKSVIVKIRMVRGTEKMLTDRARFWVVRPRLSAGNLRGIETLVSGAYIEVDPGDSGGKKQRQFKALDEPPGRQSDEPGQTYVLEVPRLGSLSTGSPIYFRDVEVGQVLSYDLGHGDGPITMRIFVRAPYDGFVHAETRFWNTSGLSLTMGAEGVHLEVESILSLLNGGIAFETPRASQDDPPAAENTKFQLYADKPAAEAAYYKLNIHYVTYFSSSVEGLVRGSPVNLFGVQVGSVTDVKLAYDWGKKSLVARVEFDVQPERILNKTGEEAVPRELSSAFKRSGMHVSLETRSLLLGGKNLTLRYLDGKKERDLSKEGEAFVLPSDPGGIDDITAKIDALATKLDKVPFDDIGKNANATLLRMQRLADRIDEQASPALARLPVVLDEMTLAAKNANMLMGAQGYGQDSEFQHDMGRVMNEVNDAARSFRVLADYLDRHPEALLRGRTGKSGER